MMAQISPDVMQPTQNHGLRLTRVLDWLDRTTGMTSTVCRLLTVVIAAPTRSSLWRFGSIQISLGPAYVEERLAAGGDE